MSRCACPPRRGRKPRGRRGPVTSALLTGGAAVVASIPAGVGFGYGSEFGSALGVRHREALKGKLGLRVEWGTGRGKGIEEISEEEAQRRQERQLRRQTVPKPTTREEAALGLRRLTTPSNWPPSHRRYALGREDGPGFVRGVGGGFWTVTARPVREGKQPAYWAILQQPNGTVVASFTVANRDGGALVALATAAAWFKREIEGGNKTGGRAATPWKPDVADVDERVLQAKARGIERTPSGFVANIRGRLSRDCRSQFYRKPPAGAEPDPKACLTASEIAEAWHALTWALHHKR